MNQEKDVPKPHQPPRPVHEPAEPEPEPEPQQPESEPEEEPAQYKLGAFAGPRPGTAILVELP